MAINGVNRIIVAVRDLEKAKSYYTDLLGAIFHEANWTGEAFGIEVAQRESFRTPIEKQ